MASLVLFTTTSLQHERCVLLPYARAERYANVALNSGTAAVMMIKVLDQYPLYNSGKVLQPMKATNYHLRIGQICMGLGKS